MGECVFGGVWVCVCIYVWGVGVGGGGLREGSGCAMVVAVQWRLCSGGV